MLIFSIVIAVFLLLALSTYNRADPGWSHFVITTDVHNAAGRTGAWLADFFLYCFGYLAYVLPLLLFYTNVHYFSRSKTDKEQPAGYGLFLLRSASFVLIMLASTGLANAYIQTVEHLPYTSGGLLGSLVSSAMLKAFNLQGASLILSAGLLIGITGFTGLSWIKLAENIGRYVIKASVFLFSKLRGINWIVFLTVTKAAFAKIKNIRLPKKLTFKQDNSQSVIPGRIEPSINRPSNSTANTFAKATSENPVIVAPAMPQAPVFIKPAVAGKAAEGEYSRGDLPSLSLLDEPQLLQNNQISEQELFQRSREMEQKLADFNITAEVVAVHPGPVVTRYELQLAAGTKASKITGLATDLARSLSIMSVRVVEVIPGKSVIGIELPNEQRESVSLKDIFASQQYQDSHSALTLALGKDISGSPVVVDLAKMPHLLVAGTTGSGKSVSLNTMLLSLLYKSTPDQLRLILIDPKMLELAVYADIPHLLVPVVTDMNDAASALRWSVMEMERRYRLMASLGVRHLAGYNTKVKEAEERGEPILDPFAEQILEHPQYLTTLPQIVIIADEFADMMVVVGKKVEQLIARLAQKARAAGIHLICATQRPSVDVITGLIKANIPTRIAFQVSSRIDSRTILDQQGAEQLLGKGDMLYLPPGTGIPVRVHGAFVDDEEVHRVINFLKKTDRADYLEEILDEQLTANIDPNTGLIKTDAQGGSGEQDALYDQAVDQVVRSRRASVSSIQRRFKIGYNRAARMVEMMEEAGLVGPMGSNGNREILVNPIDDN